MMLKIEVLAPMHSASVSTAAAVKPGLFFRTRNPYEDVLAHFGECGQRSAVAEIAIFGGVLQSGHTRFPPAVRFFELARQRVPIGDVALDRFARLLQARAQTQRFRIGVFQLTGDLFHNFGFALGTKAPQAQIPPHVIAPVRHGWAAPSG